jgi:hypothetical protein
VTTVHGPHFVPVDWQFDREARTARIAIDGFCETTSEPLTVPATDDLQRTIVKMPDGFEYKEAEVALATTVRSTGAVEFDWKGTHSSLADVEHTNEALVA